MKVKIHSGFLRAGRQLERCTHEHIMANISLKTKEIELIGGMCACRPSQIRPLDADHPNPPLDADPYPRPQMQTSSMQTLPWMQTPL